MYSKEELVKPFYIQGGKTGMLLIHGFTASPGDMRPLGEGLHQNGYTVYAPLLAGHGTTPEEMQETGWRDWTESAFQALAELKKDCTRIVAVGHSMGGLIALLLASRKMTDGVVSVNAPIIYQDRNLHFADRILGKQEFVDKPHKENDMRFNKEGLPHFSYSKVPVNCLVSLNKAITPVQNALQEIDCPILVVQSLEDRMVHPRSGRMIEKSIRHRQKDVIYWAKADHYLPLSSERDRLVEKLQRFLVKFKLS